MRLNLATAWSRCPDMPHERAELPQRRGGWETCLTFIFASYLRPPFSLNNSYAWYPYLAGSLASYRELCQYPGAAILFSEQRL